MGAIIMNLLAFVQILILHSTAVFGQCYYQQALKVNKQYYIENKEYPNYYREENHCRWVATSPNSSRISLACSVVQIPNTDSLIVAARGYSQLEWRGNVPHSQVFDTDEITIILSSVRNTIGGRFQCEMIALVDPWRTTPTPTPTPTPKPTSPSTPTETCDCGWRQVNRIVGGEETGVNEFPFMAGLVDLLNRIIMCGSTIISNRFVVSAGHCIVNKNASHIGVLVGEHNIESGTETHFTRLYLVNAYLVHEDYVDGTSPNDIALIQTKETIEFSIAVGPVCLPYTLWAKDGTYDVTELGWGTTEFGGPMSDALEKVNISTITNFQCGQKYGYTIADSQICTFSPGKDSCQYDSGGPAVWFDPTRQRYKFIGIITYGGSCADNYPGVCTRVQSFIRWIEWHTGVNYCKK